MATAFYVFGTVLLAINMVLMGLIAPVFWWLRKEPILRHRNLVLEVIYFIVVASMSVRFWFVLESADQKKPYTTCTGLIWAQGIHVIIFT